MTHYLPSTKSCLSLSSASHPISSVADNKKEEWKVENKRGKKRQGNIPNDLLVTSSPAFVTCPTSTASSITRFINSSKPYTTPTCQQINTLPDQHTRYQTQSAQQQDSATGSPTLIFPSIRIPICSYNQIDTVEFCKVIYISPHPSTYQSPPPPPIHHPHHTTANAGTTSKTYRLQQLENHITTSHNTSANPLLSIKALNPIPKSNPIRSNLTESQTDKWIAGGRYGETHIGGNNTLLPPPPPPPPRPVIIVYADLRYVLTGVRESSAVLCLVLRVWCLLNSSAPLSVSRSVSRFPLQFNSTFSFALMPFSFLFVFPFVALPVVCVACRCVHVA